jgi:nucleoside-diphosphate-sugar epimerase
MRALVAGGAGFIGATLCRRLLARGDEVVCVDSLVTGSIAHVKELSGRDAFQFVEADVTEEVPVEGPFDAVINLASPASPVDFEPLALAILDVGSRGVANLLDTAHRHGATFLQASTSEVYGEPLVHPQPESNWGNVNPIGARSVYDESKRFAEALTTAYRRRHGLQVRIARIFNTYGPGMRVDDGRVVSNFVTQALQGLPITVHGDGSQTRSFCYVDDQVSGLLSLLDSDYRGPVNIGSDDERTVLELALLVLELTGSDSQIILTGRPPDDPSQRRPDLTLARAELGWEPTTPLRTGLARTVEWFEGQIVSSGEHRMSERIPSRIGDTIDLTESGRTTSSRTITAPAV